MTDARLRRGGKKKEGPIERKYNARTGREWKKDVVQDWKRNCYEIDWS